MITSNTTVPAEAVSVIEKVSGPTKTGGRSFASIAVRVTAMVVDSRSSSSFAENLSVTFDHPDGWAVVCDGFGALSSGAVANIVLEPGHIVNVERTLGCSVLQSKGPSSGDLTTTVRTSDDVLVTSQTRSLAWNEPPEEQGLSGQVIALSGGGILVLIGVVSLVLLRNRSNDEEEVNDETAALQGPTATVEPVVEQQPTPAVATRSLSWRGV